MRRQIVFIAIFFILVAAFIKYIDIVHRYDIGIVDYLRYSQPLTSEEREYLEAGPILYGIDINDAPFAFVSDESGQNTGIVVDYFNQLSVTLESDFKPVVYPGNQISLRLKDGSTDAAVLNKTRLFQNVFSYTQPLYTERSKILVSGESEFVAISDVSDISIAVISGSSAHSAANDFFSRGQNVHLVLTEDLNESFYLFGIEEVDAILGDEAKISYYLNNGIRQNRFKFLEGSVNEEEVAVAVNPDQTTLYNVLQKGILEMKRTNQYSHINAKWFASFVPETDEPVGSGFGANMAIAVLALVFILLIWNRTVQNQVTLRTQELAESREELRDLVDSLRDGIIVTDGDGVVQVCNRSILDFLGAEADSVTGKRLTDIPELLPFLEHEGGKSIYTKNDRDYLVYHRKLNLSSPNELIFIDDYTDRHKVENLNSQEAKMIAVGELSAGLAHEIRNPLGLIKSYLYVLKRRLRAAESGQDDAVLHAISVMDDSADRINALIENLLGFSRLSPEDSSEINVRETVDSVLSLEGRRFEKNRIELRKEYELPRGEVLRLNGDVLKLCLANLINNSLDALLEGGGEDKYISLKLRDLGNKLALDFSDNGCGIEPEKMDAIFNPFFTTKEQGTGLGLYILQSELRGIGGSITAESRVGKGTHFRVLLPIG